MIGGCGFPVSTNDSVKAAAPHRLVLLGPPASGKGTQGRMMEERWRVPVVSVGEVLRKAIADGSPLGREAASFIDFGRLVPDRGAGAAGEEWLPAGGAGEACVSDGLPRTVGQAQALDEVLTRLGTPLTAVIWLELDERAIAERVSHRVTCSHCGRSFQIGWQVASREDACPVCGGKLTVRKDDDPTTLAERMGQYRQHTAPVKDFYASRGLLRVIEGGPTPEEVFAHIEAATARPQEAAAA